MKPDTPSQPFYRRIHLRHKERRATQIMRDQVAAVASLLEMLLSVMVLVGLLVSTIPIAQEMISLWFSDNTDAFQTFLGHAFNLVIGIEFIKMLSKHSPGSALEVLLYAIARHMIVGHESAVENFISVASIALIFFVRKFLFVPAFGATMPGGRKAPDIEKMEKQDTAGESEE